MKEDEVGGADGETEEEQAYRGACNYLRNSLFWRAVDALSHEAQLQFDQLIKSAESRCPTRTSVHWMSMAASLALLAASSLAQDVTTAIKHDINPAKIVPHGVRSEKIREDLKIERLGGEKARPVRAA